MKQLYRENADLRVEIELLQQLLRDNSNGLWVDSHTLLRFRLSDETLRGDYIELKMKMGDK